MSNAAVGVRRLARAALRIQGVGALTRRIAGLRGRSLVLLYHRLTEGEISGPQVVPSIPAELFRRQVEALAGVGRVVPLADLLAGADRGTPRFALTFDDDYPSHVVSALPILRELRLPATFFLSGRSLHGAGPYWFEALERWVRERGLSEVAARLEVPADLEAVILACEADEGLRRVAEEEGRDGVRHLEPGDIGALADAGMTIGFHTVDHAVLPRLSDRELEEAVRAGREELAEVVGRSLDLFAYPHGKADGRVARKVREAGYAAAWTGRPRPMHPREDRHLLGRWEPGPLPPDELLVRLSIRLSRAGRIR